MKVGSASARERERERRLIEDGAGRGQRRDHRDEEGETRLRAPSFEIEFTPREALTKSSSS